MMSRYFSKTTLAIALSVAFAALSPAINTANAQVRVVGVPMPFTSTATGGSADLVKVNHHRGNASTHAGRRDRAERGKNRRWIKRGWKKRRGDDRGRFDDHGERRYVKPRQVHPRYRHGHRGYPTYRKGYRRDNDGWFYPLAAFALGAIILNQQTNNRSGVVQGNSGWSHIPSGNLAAHDDWCDRKYRSYSRATKTFQPYNGPRKYCNSPYDGI